MSLPHSLPFSRRFSAFPLRMRVLLGLTVCAFLSSCVSLTSVRNFSAASAETLGHHEVIDDYAESARRYLLYRDPSNQAALEQNLAQARANRTNLLALQAVLVEYLEALGKLASDQGEPLVAPGSKLADGVTSSHLVGADDAKAVKALATLTLRLVAGGKQQRALREVIGEANEPVQRITAALQKFAGEEYPAQLRREAGAMRQMLSENIAENPRLDADLAPLKGIARLMYDERNGALEDKLARAEPYQQALAKIAAGHQALYESREHLDTKNIAARLKTYTADLKVLSKAVRR